MPECAYGVAVPSLYYPDKWVYQACFAGCKSSTKKFAIVPNCSLETAIKHMTLLESVFGEWFTWEVDTIPEEFVPPYRLTKVTGWTKKDIRISKDDWIIVYLKNTSWICFILFGTLVRMLNEHGHTMDVMYAHKENYPTADNFFHEHYREWQPGDRGNDNHFPHGVYPVEDATLYKVKNHIEKNSRTDDYWERLLLVKDSV